MNDHSLESKKNKKTKTLYILKRIEMPCLGGGALFWAFLLIRDRGGVPGPGVEGGGGSLPALKMLCGTLHPDAGGPAAASGAGGMPIEALTWSLRARRLKAMLSGQSCPAVSGTGPHTPALGANSSLAEKQSCCDPPSSTPA